MARTTNYDLYKIDLDQPNWQHLYNDFVGRLNSNVLKLQYLNDVSVQALQDGSILQYNSTNSKWEVVAIRR